jgi:2-oxoglutarate ferredoxin oxidoreductase subunit beta
MTGGQVSPTTPSSVKTTTTPYGNIEPPFKIAELVAAAGASYVARYSTYHIFKLKKAMKEMFDKKGFSFIEIISQCPTSYGRKVGQKEGIDQLKHFKENSIDIKNVNKYQESELEDKIVIGKLVDRNRREFVEGLQEINRKISG